MTWAGSGRRGLARRAAWWRQATGSTVGRTVHSAGSGIAGIGKSVVLKRLVLVESKNEAFRHTRCSEMC
jgi:hypothetical protein